MGCNVRRCNKAWKCPRMSRQLDSLKYLNRSEIHEFRYSGTECEKLKAVNNVVSGLVDPYVSRSVFHSRVRESRSKQSSKCVNSVSRNTNVCLNCGAFEDANSKAADLFEPQNATGRGAKSQRERTIQVRQTEKFSVVG
jgi:hypothetical protein